MAISKANGREYESRREKGYRPDKRPYKPTPYPKGYDRLGQPNTCGFRDPETGKECPEPNFEHYVRCEHHQTLHEEELERKGLIDRDRLRRYNEWLL